MNQCSVTVSSDAVACAVVAGSAASSCAVWGVAFDAAGSGCHGGSAFSAGLSDVDSDASACPWECCEEFGEVWVAFEWWAAGDGSGVGVEGFGVCGGPFEEVSGHRRVP